MHSIDVLEGWLDSQLAGQSDFCEALVFGDHPKAATIADDHSRAVLGTMLFVTGQHFPREAYRSTAALAARRDAWLRQPRSPNPGRHANSR